MGALWMVAVLQFAAYGGLVRKCITPATQSDFNERENSGIICFNKAKKPTRSYVHAINQHRTKGAA